MTKNYIDDIEVHNEYEGINPIDCLAVNISAEDQNQKDVDEEIQDMLLYYNKLQIRY